MLIRSSRLGRNRARRGGFTLMEVLVVVAILVILAGVGGVIFISIQEDAEMDLARVRAKEIETALQGYKNRYKQYPDSLQELVVPPEQGRTPYITPDKLVDPWGKPYQYRNPGTQGDNQVRRVPDVWSTGPQGTSMIGNWGQTATQ